jgi:hypothetical protein
MQHIPTGPQVHVRIAHPHHAKRSALSTIALKEEKRLNMEIDSRETDKTARRLTGTLTPDSEGFGPIGGLIGIGIVPEVNGEGALEATEFVPTRHELSIIARYWLKERVNVRFNWFCFGDSGSREIRIDPFAYRRLGRIKQILGEDAIQKLHDEVMSELEAKVDPRLWKMFLNGEEPERGEYGFPVLPPQT